MRKPFVLSTIALTLCLSLVFAGVAYGVQPPPVPFATVEKVQAMIAEAVAGLQTQIDALAARLGVVESADVNQESRISALEAAAPPHIAHGSVMLDASGTSPVLSCPDTAHVVATYTYHYTGMSPEPIWIQHYSWGCAIHGSPNYGVDWIAVW